MQLDEDALAITRYFFKENKSVAAIFHGPKVLVSAGVIKGRKATCWLEIRSDIVGAGLENPSIKFGILFSTPKIFY